MSLMSSSWQTPGGWWMLLWSQKQEMPWSFPGDKGTLFSNLQQIYRINCTWLAVERAYVSLFCFYFLSNMWSLNRKKRHAKGGWKTERRKERARELERWRYTQVWRKERKRQWEGEPERASAMVHSLWSISHGNKEVWRPVAGKGGCRSAVCI